MCSLIQQLKDIENRVLNESPTFYMTATLFERPTRDTNALPHYYCAPRYYINIYCMNIYELYEYVNLDGSYI